MYSTPDQMLKEILESMDANIRAFENGGDVDMLSFDDKVRKFCAVLSGLPKFEAKKYEGSLKVVIERLSQLIPKIEAKRDELEDKITSLNKRNLAYNAYGNAIVLALQTMQGDE